MKSKNSMDREEKIQECLHQLENLHLEIMKKKEDTNDWRELAEKSLTQQISVLRLWQGESRLLNNWKMATMSLTGVVVGFLGSLMYTFIN